MDSNKLKFPLTLRAARNGDRFVPFAIGRPDRCYLLSADKDMAVFGTLYPQYAVKEVEDFNHKSCDTRQMYKLYYVVNNGAGK